MGALKTDMSVLFINRKWNTGFRLVPKSVTLNDLERHIECVYSHASADNKITDKRQVDNGHHND